MSENTQRPEGTTGARRRLLRGMLAAPAVLPLSGGAQAAVASNLRCVVNQINNDPKQTESEIWWTDSGDTWVRVKLWRATRPGTTDRFRYYVKGEDISLIANGKPITSTAPTTGQWMLVKNGGGTGGFNPTGQVLAVPFNYGAPPAWTRDTYSPGVATKDYDSPQWAAVRFDKDGKIVGVVPVGSSPSSAIKKSCWTSFSGFTAYPG